MRKKEKIRFLFCVLVFCVLYVCIPVKGYQEGLSDEQLYGNGEENVLGHKAADRRNATNQDEGVNYTKQSNVRLESAMEQSEVESTEQSKTEVVTEQSKTEMTTEQSETEMTTEQSETEMTTEQSETEMTTERLKTKITTEQVKLQETKYDNVAKKKELHMILEQLKEDVQLRCKSEINISDIRKVAEANISVSRCKIKINGQEVVEGIITKAGEYDVELELLDRNGMQEKGVVTVVIMETANSDSGWIYIGASACVLMIGCGLLIGLKRKHFMESNKMQEKEMEEKNVRKKRNKK